MMSIYPKGTTEDKVYMLMITLVKLKIAEQYFHRWLMKDATADVDEIRDKIRDFVTNQYLRRNPSALRYI